MYCCQCDNCQDMHEYDGFVAWVDEGQAKESAMESDWTTEGGLHFCPSCFEYDNEDNLIINKSRTKKR